ncbi:MAG TPA: hypothetical protein PLL77_02150 [Pyrinomonadaceae bacterium]|nr:hypothetical protein [Pyrinomonadaceae bacterium]
MSNDSIWLFAAISAVVSTLMAPILALQIQKLLERQREADNRRLNIFKTLMATRSSRLSPQHVEALNMIDVEFHKKKRFKKIVDAWGEYRDNLNNFPEDDEAADHKARVEVWFSTNDQRFTDLLYEMGQSLNYKFDKVHLKRSMYFPKGLGELDTDGNIIRKALVSLLTGENAIKMAVVDFPDMEDTEGQKKLLEAMAQSIRGPLDEGLEK